MIRRLYLFRASGRRRSIQIAWSASCGAERAITGSPYWAVRKVAVWGGTVTGPPQTFAPRTIPDCFRRDRGEALPGGVLLRTPMLYNAPVPADGRAGRWVGGNILPTGALSELRMDLRWVGRAIASAKAGDADGYAQLLEAYGPRLYAYFFRATGHHHDAEDLLSELSLRLVRSLKGYDDRGRFDHWLFRIAANMVRARIRRIRVAPKVASLSLTEDADKRLADRLRGGARTADAAAMAVEASEALKVGLAKLDEMTRQMILLRYFGQMSFKELAELFQCPLGTALARVHRGLRALRMVMGDDDDGQ